jgi:hypothetical protein
MKTILANVVAIGLVLAAAGIVAAHGPKGHHGQHPGHTQMKNPMHHPSHGQYGGYKFSHGNWYSKDSFYWNYRCYSPKYGCDVYWSPTESCYYYYYPTASCYYPVTYIAYAPPVVSTKVVTIVAATSTPVAALANAVPDLQRPDNVPPVP